MSPDTREVPKKKVHLVKSPFAWLFGLLAPPNENPCDSSEGWNRGCCCCKSASCLKLTVALLAWSLRTSSEGKNLSSPTCLCCWLILLLLVTSACWALLLFTTWACWGFDTGCNTVWTLLRLLWFGWGICALGVALKSLNILWPCKTSSGGKNRLAVGVFLWKFRLDWGWEGKSPAGGSGITAVERRGLGPSTKKDLGKELKGLSCLLWASSGVIGRNSELVKNLSTWNASSFLAWRACRAISSNASRLVSPAVSKRLDEARWCSIRSCSGKMTSFIKPISLSSSKNRGTKRSASVRETKDVDDLLNGWSANGGRLMGWRWGPAAGNDDDEEVISSENFAVITK